MQNPAAHGFEKRHKLFKVFRSQPTRIEMFSVAARWHPPETRKSTAAPPRSMTMAPRRLTSASSVVDISIQILSVFSSGTISSITAADASGDGRQVMATSQSRIIAAGPSARAARNEVVYETFVQIMDLSNQSHYAIVSRTVCRPHFPIQ